MSIPYFKINWYENPLENDKNFRRILREFSTLRPGEVSSRQFYGSVDDDTDEKAPEREGMFCGRWKQVVAMRWNKSDVICNRLCDLKIFHLLDGFLASSRSTALNRLERFWVVFTEIELHSSSAVIMLRSRTQADSTKKI